MKKKEIKIVKTWKGEVVLSFRIESITNKKGDFIKDVSHIIINIPFENFHQHVPDHVEKVLAYIFGRDDYCYAIADSNDW